MPPAKSDDKVKTEGGIYTDSLSEYHTENPDICLTYSFFPKPIPVWMAFEDIIPEEEGWTPDPKFDWIILPDGLVVLPLDVARFRVGAAATAAGVAVSRLYTYEVLWKAEPGFHAKILEEGKKLEKKRYHKREMSRLTEDVLWSIWDKDTEIFDDRLGR